MHAHKLPPSIRDSQAVPLPESELPLLLPDMEDFTPSGTPEPPLARAGDWLRTSTPGTGEPAAREASTMPQWAGSCWYYLRYIDPHNQDRWASEFVYS